MSKIINTKDIKIGDMYRRKAKISTRPNPHPILTVEKIYDGGEFIKLSGRTYVIKFLTLCEKVSELSVKNI